MPGRHANTTIGQSRAVREDVSAPPAAIRQDTITGAASRTAPAELRLVAILVWTSYLAALASILWPRLAPVTWLSALGLLAWASARLLVRASGVTRRSLAGHWMTRRLIMTAAAIITAGLVSPVRDLHPLIALANVATGTILALIAPIPESVNLRMQRRWRSRRAERRRYREASDRVDEARQVTERELGQLHDQLAAMHEGRLCGSEVTLPPHQMSRVPPFVLPGEADDEFLAAMSARIDRNDARLGAVFDIMRQAAQVTGIPWHSQPGRPALRVVRATDPEATDSEAS